MSHSSNPRGRFRPRDGSSFDLDLESDLQNSPTSRRNRGKATQKTRQLCRQAFRTLSLALSACSDDVVRDLNVLSVEPAPDAGRLLVRVYPAPSPEGVSPIRILDRLERVQGRLRAEVARSLSRKRAPELLFQVVSPEGGIQ